MLGISPPQPSEKVNFLLTCFNYFLKLKGQTHIVISVLTFLSCINKVVTLKYIFFKEIF